MDKASFFVFNKFEPREFNETNCEMFFNVNELIILKIYYLNRKIMIN